MLLYPYRLANRCVTNGEWLAFMEAGGYGEPLVWLADGWASVKAQGWQAPGYWEQRDGVWHQMTLEGLLPVDPRAPVTHVSYYEANAFANWAGKRLPTEFEWEAASAGYPVAGNDLATNALRPRPAMAAGDGRLAQMFGDVWEWTLERLPAVPRLSPGRRARRRIQRQVHGQPERAARRLVRDRAGPRAPPTATSSTRISAGSSPACASPRTPHERRTRAAAPRCRRRARDRRRRAVSSPMRSSTGCRHGRNRSPAASSTMRAGSALFEAITELPEYYPTRTETAILRDHAATWRRWRRPARC